MANFLSRRSQKESRQRQGNGHRSDSARLSRKRDLFLAFAIVSLPLLIIAILLLAFVFTPSQRERPDLSAETRELPFTDYESTDYYYTRMRSGAFLLVASWASNIAELIVAPFMLLFSYAVAREILQQSATDPKRADVRPPLLHEIMSGAYAGIWHWITHKISKKNTTTRQKPLSLQVLDIAAFGLSMAGLLTLLVIIGDNWLHATTHSINMTHYDPVTDFQDNGDMPGGYSTLDICNETLTAPLPQNVSSASLPCSLNETNGLTNVANPKFVYLTLGKGISQITSNFNSLDFSFLDEAEERGTATPYQVVTHLEGNANHALFFAPDAAQEDDLSDFGLGRNYGIDFVANTTSMVTECTFATQRCNLSTVDSGDNNISIPFRCYDDFSGNLGQTPATGHEKAQGWNMSFYEIVAGSPRNIPVQAQSNPFHFFAAAAVNSINLQDLELQMGSNNAELAAGSFVDAGRGFTGFALDCSATIFDVTYSLINGSFFEFNSTKSSPQKASIIKAPLQVGFGQFQLYQAASLAVLANNDSVASTMGLAFSQTGMALASGVFDFDNNTLQRYRWTMNATRVQKAPFYYLVIVCLMYSMFGVAMTIMALWFRRIPEVREQQARLIIPWNPEIPEIEQPTEKPLDYATP